MKIRVIFEENEPDDFTQFELNLSAAGPSAFARSILEVVETSGFSQMKFLADAIVLKIDDIETVAMLFRNSDHKERLKQAFGNIQ